MGSIVQIFKDGVAKGIFIDRHPIALADTFWSLFSGVILWMTSKKLVNDSKDHLKDTLTLAFDVFYRGIKVQVAGSRATGKETGDLVHLEPRPAGGPAWRRASTPVPLSRHLPDAGDLDPVRRQPPLQLRARSPAGSRSGAPPSRSAPTGAMPSRRQTRRVSG